MYCLQLKPFYQNILYLGLGYPLNNTTLNNISVIIWRSVLLKNKKKSLQKKMLNGHSTFPGFFYAKLKSQSPQITTMTAIRFCICPWTLQSLIPLNKLLTGYSDNGKFIVTLHITFCHWFRLGQ